MLTGKDSEFHKMTNMVINDKLKIREKTIEIKIGL